MLAHVFAILSMLILTSKKHRTTTKIKDFCFPKPFQNHPQMPPKWKLQKTSSFSKLFCYFLYIFSIFWFLRNINFTNGQFQVFAQSALLQFSTNFFSKIIQKPFQNQAWTKKISMSKINITFFDVNFFASWPRFGRAAGLQDEPELARLAFQNFCVAPLETS